ncbi:MAG: response regulator [Acidobacteria bacterium]|nr:response regulator [Acidobacteriota bacterium]MBI3654850.1 response regulator [Acidobacteriota bacterium]
MQRKDQKAHVLVVDDDKNNCDFFFRLLTEQGYQVFTTTKSLEALAIAANNSIDLVLLDIKLPDLDGIETLKRLKKLDKDLTVIMLTAYGSLATARDAMALGAYDYITKPFDLKFVKKVVKNGIEERVSWKHPSMVEG